ncbi:MAG: sulfotransferase [Planctomycetota bacterium]|nr:sulfotransferase [Planctomycetota bacterium]
MPGPEDCITIVSGLPRSGTSLMMQMLAAGGLPPLTDGQRAADPDNPKGYYELEAVKRTKHDPSWLDDAPGRVVKMVHLLLYDLPADRSYRIVFMKRDLEEVVRSQQAMLARTGQTGAQLPPEKLIAAFQSQYRKIETWLAQQDNFDLLSISYNDLIADPAPAIAALNAFLGGELDEQAMRNAVDAGLYRQRSDERD